VGHDNVTREWLWKLADVAAVIKSESMLRSILASMASETGFDFYAYTHMRPADPFAVSNYPAGWQRLYVDQRFDRVDPVVAQARHRPQMFAWGHDRVFFRRTAEAKRFANKASQFGIRTGISIPVRAPFGDLVILTLASGERSVPVDCTGNAAIAASAVAFLHASVEATELCSATGDRPSLTDRQALLLRWSAEGKSMKDIALIENMSYHNVNFHLNNARKALNANTLAQATAIATKLKLI
jgi:LuxR family transcriptional activator of conjugal transfer of Ti plasmids